MAPRNVRNFWVDGTIDGRVSRLQGGPQSRDGGFRLTIYQRDRGEVTTAIEIEGSVNSDGNPVLRVNFNDFDEDYTFVTER